MPSDSIAHYELGAKIGEGGMGEVYRATDTKLHRDVALKLLPAEFVADHERLERFRREARALATLNHPNVGAIHGIEESDERVALVLELIEGDTLADRIADQGPLPLSDVGHYAEQIAAALEAAHERGIVHRDLKPANIKITPAGQVKVLDFGLAKATGAGSGREGGVAESPTIMMTAAMPGVIMGTAPYMAPEQARGADVDQRADIWAYGAILFEMVTGERLFSGDDVTEVLACVISREPDLSRLPDDLPGWLHDLIGRCLRRDITMRLPHMASARIAIVEAQSATDEPIGTAPDPAGGSGWALTLGMLAVGLLIGVVGQRLLIGTAPEIPVQTTYGELVFDPPPVPEGAPVLSPDGRTLAYVGGDESNSRMIYLRSLDDGTTRALPGSHYAFEPIFSPDGQQLLFAAAGRLLVARLGGGLPTAITAVAGTAEGSVWLPDDTIVYAALGTRFLQRVSVNGGTPEELRFEGVGDTTWTADPAALPDPDKLLVSLQDAGGDSEPEIAVISLREGWLRRLVRGSSPRFVPPNHLVFLQRSGLMVAPFDPDSLEMLGPERALTPAGGELISVRRTAGPSLLAAISVDGTALFPMSLPEGRRVVWVDQEGNEEDTGYGFAGGNMRTFSANGAASVSLSPDGRRIVVIEGDTPVIVDLDAVDQRRVLPRVGTSTAYAGWMPSGDAVYVLSNRDGDFRSYRVLATGGQTPEPITRLPQSVLTSMLPGGQGALGYVIDQARSRDLYEFDAQGEGTALLATTANERAAQISPDGQAFAYVSNELGEDRVYLRRYPDVGTVWPISGDFGSAPRWSADGSEIYYFEDNFMMAMTVDLGDRGVVTGPARRLFSIGPYEEDPFGNTMYDVDDQGRFIMVRLGTGARTWRWVQNWSAQLELPDAP